MLVKLPPCFSDMPTTGFVDPVHVVAISISRDRPSVLIFGHESKPIGGADFATREDAENWAQQVATIVNDALRVTPARR